MWWLELGVSRVWWLESSMVFSSEFGSVWSCRVHCAKCESMRVEFRGKRVRGNVVEFGVYAMHVRFYQGEQEFAVVVRIGVLPV